MRFNLDSHFGVHAQALKLHARRLEVLAANIQSALTFLSARNLMLAITGQ